MVNAEGQAPTIRPIVEQQGTGDIDQAPFDIADDPSYFPPLSSSPQQRRNGSEPIHEMNPEFQRPSPSPIGSSWSSQRRSSDVFLSKKERSSPIVKHESAGDTRSSQGSQPKLDVGSPERARIDTQSAALQGSQQSDTRTAPSSSLDSHFLRSGTPNRQHRSEEQGGDLTRYQEANRRKRERFEAEQMQLEMEVQEQQASMADLQESARLNVRSGFHVDSDTD